MRIRGAQSPPPYLNRRDQYRMLIMVGLLGVTLLAIKMTARPSFWGWMFPSNARTAAPSESPKGGSDSDSDTSTDTAAIDHTVVFDRELGPDEFLAQTRRGVPTNPRPQEVDASGGGGRADHDSQSGSAGRAGDDEDVAEPPREVIPLDLTSSRVNPVFLQGIVDRRVGLRRSEADAYFGILAKISRLPASVLEEAPVLDADYTVLMTEPEYYRGRLVRLQGVVRRLVGFSAAENPYGVETLYDVWLFTEDSGNNPLHIRCTEVPRDIPQGLSLAKEVRVSVTGYFFRIEGYESQGGLHTAPLILAGGLDWQQPVELTRSQKAIVPYVGTFVALVTVAVILVLWRFRRSDRAFERSRVRELAEPDGSSIAELHDLPTTDVHDFLRSLHESDHPPGDSR